MKLSAFFVGLAVAASMLFGPALASASLGDLPVAAPIECHAGLAVLTPADFAVNVVSPAVEQFTCDAALLAESGLCIVQVEPARLGFAFAQPPDPVFVAAAGTCLGGRSPTG